MVFEWFCQSAVWLVMADCQFWAARYSNHSKTLYILLQHASGCLLALLCRIVPQSFPSFEHVSVIWSSDIWSFWLYFGYMVNGQSDFSTKFFGYMVISAIWLTLLGQNRGPYIRNPVYLNAARVYLWVETASGPEIHSIVAWCAVCENGRIMTPILRRHTGRTNLPTGNCKNAARAHAAPTSRRPDRYRIR